MWKSFYIKLVCLFCFFICVASCSYAYTLEQFLDFTQQVHDLNVSTNLNYHTGKVLTYKDNFINNTTINNAVSFLGVTNNNSTGYAQVFYFNSPKSFSITASGLLTTSRYDGYFTINQNNGTVSVTNTSGNFNARSKLACWGLVQMTDNIDLTGFYLQNVYVPPYTGPVFTPFNEGQLPVYFNGNMSMFHSLDFTYSVNQVKLGYITNWEDVQSLYGYFGPYVSGDIADVSQNQFSYNLGEFYNGSLAFVDYDGSVWIKTSKLIPKQGYKLLLSYRHDNSVTDFAEVNFYSRFTNDLVPSGDLISSELNSNVDIGFINAIDDFFKQTSGDKLTNISLINGLFSGDFVPSGDPFASVFSGDFFGLWYTDYDNFGFGDFVFNLYRSIYYILNSYQDVTINFGFLGDINSSQFIINNSVVTDFLSIFSDAIFLILLIMFYYRFIVAISTFDITTFLNFDFDSLFHLF